MTDDTPKQPKAPRPSPINGPAFFVFGILFILISYGMELPPLMWPGIAFLLAGLVGIMLQRRYDKAAGIEEVLPGKSPERPERED